MTLQERNELVNTLYNCQDRGERLALIPELDGNELEQLQQLFHPRWDGNVISKYGRDSLVNKGLAERWNGWNFITNLGMAVLELRGVLDEDWERSIHKNCVRRLI